ncbi:MAG: hypothetical protein HOO06_11365 [Bdellovibrionaceae bacterium]|nr:hypothetical protein [Pseudobdellovibrionaceae bacterium]
MMKFNKVVLSLVMMLFVQPVFAQDEAAGEKGLEYGFHMGRLLPNQVDGATEILPLWGLRVGYALPGGGPTVESGVILGSGEGVNWSGLELSMRTEMKIEDLVGIIYVGADVTRYEGIGQSANVYGGGHVGGGVMSQIGRSTWVRVDMKFMATPGTSLYINVGLLFR